MKRIFFSLLLSLVQSLFGHNDQWTKAKYDAFLQRDQFPGFCSHEKGELIMDLMFEVKPKTVVEIGALGGSATCFIANALKCLGRGTVYAIDSWDNRSFYEGLEFDDPLVSWWLGLNVDMDHIYRHFNSVLLEKQLVLHCHPMKIDSRQAVSYFADESVDLLYLDGNVSRSGSLEDVTLFFPKVAKGGYIYLDCADLETKDKTVAFLMHHCQWIKEKSIPIQFLLFRKP